MSPNDHPEPDRPYRVLVVDGSAVARATLARVLGELDGVVVAGTAADGREAIRAIARAALTDAPIDIVLLDIERPVTDGPTALAGLSAVRPPPKIIVSSALTHRGAAASLRAMLTGAGDRVGDPSSAPGSVGGGPMHDPAAEIACWGAAARRHPAISATDRRSARPIGTRPDRPAPDDAARATAPIARPACLLPFAAPASADAELAVPCRPPVERPATRPGVARSEAGSAVRAVAIGGSTGAPQALMRIFGGLRGELRGPVFVTQHMPVGFTAILAEQLARVSGRPCREAEHGERVIGGRIYVAPGDHHLTVRPHGDDVVIELSKDPPESFCRPAVDPMLRSLSAAYGSSLLAVVLTGMGQDGLKGCAAVKRAGGRVIVQDRPSSVVWGMPGAVVRHGLADRELPLDRIAAALVRGGGNSDG